MHASIKELHTNDSFTDFYLLKNYIKQAKKNGDPYFRVELADNSGTCSGISWENPDQFDVTQKCIGSIVKVKGVMNDYNGVPQMRIFNIRQAREDDFNLFDTSDIVTTAPIDTNEYQQALEKMIDEIADDDYRLVSQTIYSEIKEEFLNIPAGKTVHHSFRCGLLMHTVNMMKLSLMTAELYHEIIDKDLLVAATFLHDIAKIQEFTLSELDLVSDYSAEGQLLGHLYMGAAKVKEVCERLNVNEHKKLMLEHLILSHHGEPDKGAVVTPKCAEAEVLHIIDLLDSRLEIYAEEYEGLEVGQFSLKKNWALDHRIYRNK